MAGSFVPSIMPNGHDQTVYLVVNNYGKSGAAFAETDLVLPSSDGRKLSR